MQKYNGQLIRQFASSITGNAASGVTVTVRRQSDAGLATLYVEDNIAGATLSNPITTTSTGHFAFYAPDDVYTLTFSDSTPVQVIQLQDVAELQAQFDAAVLNAGYIPSGTFTAGATLTQANQVLSDGSSYWRWDGSFPKVVTAGSEPTPTGVGNWIVLSDFALRGDLADPASTVLIADVEAKQVAASALELPSADIKPYFLDHFINGFGGRGMLTAETPSISTEVSVTADAAAGSNSIAVSSTTNFVVGSRVTIFHASVGKYETYFVNSKSSTTLGIPQGLKYSVNTSSKVERTWYNQPHAGKFYMRQLAQRIANEPAYNLETPSNGRVFFSQLDSDPTAGSDVLTGVSGATVSYVDQLNVSQGDIAVPLESSIGRAAFIEVSSNGQGAETVQFKTYGVTTAVFRACVMCRSESVIVSLKVLDSDGNTHCEIMLNSGKEIRVANIYSVPLKLPAKTETVSIQIVAKSGVTGTTSVIVDQLEVFASDAGLMPVMPKAKPIKIVGIGDSWIAGDILDSERESILTQLALELPFANIVNKGVGGSRIDEIWGRIETDVVAEMPDYVIINAGTNDCYSPPSGTFFPNSVDFYERYLNMIISRIMSIGAIPILIGTPALAESDGAFSSWQLNDRAKTYSRYFYKRFSQVVNFVAPEDEPEVFTYTPSLKVNGSETGVTYSSRSGKYTRSGKIISFNIAITLSNKGASSGVVTITLPPISPLSGEVYPFTMTCGNVSSATGMQAVANIGASNEMRLQIPTATGTSAASETNIANNSIFWIAGSYLTDSI